jgi:hypothetical protein
MMLWDMYKKGFYAWEGATAKLLEQWLRSPLVLGPSGALLTATMKAKAQTLRGGVVGRPRAADQARPGADDARAESAPEQGHRSRREAGRTSDGEGVMPWM